MKTTLSLVSILITLLFSQISGYSQTNFFSNWDIEAGISRISGGNDLVEIAHNVFFNVDYGSCNKYYLAIRKNVGDKVSVGGEVSYYGWTNKLTPRVYSYSDYNAEMISSAVTALANVDYRFYSGERIIPFVGLGCGYGYSERRIEDWITPHEENRNINKSEHFNSFVVSPRIGEYFFGHISLSVEYNWAVGDKYNSYFAVRAGLYW